MYLDKKNFGDAGYIGMELMDFEKKPVELRQKCFAIEKSVNEGYFNLDKAIEVYGVSQDDFINYLLNNLIKEVKHSTNEIESREADAKKLLNIMASIAFIYSSRINLTPGDLKNKFAELALIGGLSSH
jgi:hypothetical protein